MLGVNLNSVNHSEHSVEMKMLIVTEQEEREAIEVAVRELEEGGAEEVIDEGTIVIKKKERGHTQKVERSEGK